MTWTATMVFQDGRMDLNITLFNEDLEPVCTAQQLAFVLEAKGKFLPGKSESKF